MDYFLVRWFRPGTHSFSLADDGLFALSEFYDLGWSKAFLTFESWPFLSEELLYFNEEL